MKEWVVAVDFLITAPTEEEAKAALSRSGIVHDNLIGEVTIMSVEEVEEL